MLFADDFRAVPQPDAELEAGVGLHFGEVSYGNIGSGQRLDFTVIGRDVNLASRIQSLCWQLSKPVLLSERFASLVGSKVISVGRHAIKGFDEPVELFVARKDEVADAGLLQGRENGDGSV